MTDESLFEVGKNVATTEGAVVFENDYFQLIEYKPLTDTVYEKPFLLFPPSINKYYILDLNEKKSLVRYLVAQGYTVFVISWRNPTAAQAATVAAAVSAEAASRAAVGQTVAAVEQQLIIDTLEHCLGNRTHAATILGISIRTLRNKLNEYSDEGTPIPAPQSGVAASGYAA